MGTTKQRLIQVMDALGIKQYEPVTTCEGITKNMLQNLWNSPTETVTTNILEPFCKRYPEVNCNWLLRGEGSMLLNTEPEQVESGDKYYEFCKLLLQNKQKENELYSELAKLMREG